MEQNLSQYKDKTVLITGGAGCIGSNLARALIEAQAARIIVLDDLSAAYEWNIPKSERVLFVKGNVLDDEMLKRVFKDKPDYVFHLAAHFANQNSVDNPETDLMVNGMGTLKVLEHAHIASVKRFVYSSSGCGVYGLKSRIPFEEPDISISLHTPYQVTKLLGELYTNYFHNLYGLPTVNARFFNVYGPGEVPGKYRNVIPNFFYWAMNGQALPITGDGTETRDWTYVDDIIKGLLAMGIREEAVGEAINLGSSTEHQVIELANMVNSLTNNEAGINYVSRRNWDVKTHLRSSIDKARKLLDYQPQTKFEDGLKKVHGWFVENWENIRRDAEF
jgi:UDP-glucose 4-epimerase